jgi:CBS domain-containing protein
MIKLRDIMTQDVVSIGPEMSIRDAMSLLSARHITGVPVIAGGEVVGIVTSTDLLAFASELPGTPAERRDQSELVEWQATDEAEASMIADAEPPASFYAALWDNDGADVALRFASVAGPESSALDEHTVEEAMTRSPIRKLPSDTTLPVAADFMRHYGVHRVLVMDRESLQGIVTATDIANAVADHKLTERTFVFGGSAGKPAHSEPTLGSHLRRAGD